jgi:hypothetical protein
MKLYYRNTECTSSKLHISVQCRGFRDASFILNGKISNTAKEIVHFIRIRVLIDPEEEGSKILANVIHLPFFFFIV